MKRRLLASLDALNGAVRIGYPKRRQLIVEVARYLISYWRGEVEFMSSDEPVLAIPQELVELCRTLLACPNEFVLTQQQLIESALYSRLGLLLGRWGAWEILVEKDRERAEKEGGTFHAEAQMSMAVAFSEDENPCTKNTHIVSRKSYPDLVYDQTNEAHIIEKKDTAELPDISTLAIVKPKMGASDSGSVSPKPEEKSKATSPQNAASMSPRSLAPSESSEARAFEASHTWQAAAKLFKEGWWQNLLSLEPTDLPRTPISVPTAQDDDILYHGEQV